MRRELAFLVVGFLAFAGCTTEDMHSFLRDEPAPLSKFLPNHRLLVRQPDTFPFHYFYLKRKVRAYERVYVAPVSTETLRESEGWAQFDRALSGQLGFQMEHLCDYTRQAYIQAFRREQSSSHLRVVRRRDLPRTLVVEPAIVAVKPTKAELNVVGTAGSFIIPGLGLVTSAMSSGSITVECRVRDAKTGEIVAMYADTESDPHAVLAISKFTWMNSMMINIKTIAAQSAKVLSVRDYRTISRDFPIRFVTLISDADLEED